MTAAKKFVRGIVARPSGDSRLLGRDDNFNLLCSLTAETFDQYFAGSAVRRIGYERFRRNLLVATFSLGQEHDSLINDPLPLVQAQCRELFPI